VRIHHVALRTHDLARLERFYVGVLGFAIARGRRGSVWLEAEGAMLMLEEAEEGEPVGRPGTKELLAFAVDELESWRGRVSVEAETQHTLYFRDPDGRRIAVSTYPLGER
jgi:catechol 2,3-dioxygenase-like lactoylglutathione lyase family enzyme